jgi:hypothetical protein
MPAMKAAVGLSLARRATWGRWRISDAMKSIVRPRKTSSEVRRAVDAAADDDRASRGAAAVALMRVAGC